MTLQLKYIPHLFDPLAVHKYVFLQMLRVQFSWLSNPRPNKISSRTTNSAVGYKSLNLHFKTIPHLLDPLAVQKYRTATLGVPSYTRSS